MTTFWLGAAILVAITLAMILPPLLGRGRWGSVERDRLNIGIYEDRLAELERELAGDEISSDQFQVARGELQRDLLNSTGDAGKKTGATTSGRRAAILVGVVVPAVALAIYWQIGAPQLSQNQHATKPQMPEEMDQMVEALHQRLERDPDDTEGWKLLGRTLVFMERFDEAARAIGRAVDLTASHPDPDLLAQYAEILAFSQGGSLAGKPIDLVEQALALNPDSLHPLWLAGMHAYALGDIPTALKQWRHLSTLLSPEDEMATTLRDAIAEAEAAVGGKSSAENTDPNVATAAVKLKLVIDDALAEKVAPSDTLFVFARPTGQKIPIAGVRRTAGELPLTITLSDADVMFAGQSLADYKQIEIVARISRSGQTAARSGDLEGETRVSVGDKKAVTIKIATVLP